MKITLLFLGLFLLFSCGEEKKELNVFEKAKIEQETHEKVKAENEQKLDEVTQEFFNRSEEEVIKYRVMMGAELKMYNALPQKGMSFIARYTNLRTYMGGLVMALDRYDLPVAKERAQKTIEMMSKIPEREKSLKLMQLVLNRIIEK